MRGANKSLAKELKGTVKEILGTCFSVGCQVDGKSPKDVSEMVESGEMEGASPTYGMRLRLIAGSSGRMSIF